MGRALETQPRADWDALKLAYCKTTCAWPTHSRRFTASTSTPQACAPSNCVRWMTCAAFRSPISNILRERQLAVPPFGDLLAAPERDIVYVSASSGSTGVPTASPFTARDFDDWMDYEGANSGRPACAARPLLPCAEFLAVCRRPVRAGAQKLGSLVHPRRHAAVRAAAGGAAPVSGHGDVDHAVLRLASGRNRAESRAGPRSELAVRRIFVAGEPGGSIPKTRQRIRALWGPREYDYYGLSDIFGSCAGMCEEQDGLHWAEDHILAEVLDPETGQPVADGERGEAGADHAEKTARPLIRFRTGDIVSFTTEPAAADAPCNACWAPMAGWTIC